MGLGMFLYRVERPMLPYINTTPYDAKHGNPELYTKMKPYLRTKHYGQNCKTESLYEDLGGWSAPQVHKWLLCKLRIVSFYNYNYLVNEDWLRELFTICLEILEKTKMEQGEVATSYTYISPEGNNRINTKHGYVIANPEIARLLLPLDEEYFHGITMYDDEYMAQIAETIGILGKALFQTDFSTQAICYHWG